MKTIRIKAGKKIFTAELYDSQAAEELVKMMPFSINVSELNGNEYYSYLEKDIPNCPAYSGQINAGDIMLFESDCIVIFYHSFVTGYSYTKIGHIQTPEKLKAALNENRRLTFYFPS